MEIRNLITFVHVAELNSFTKAAKALDYSQSTVSFQIKQLENELDCLLFERINHSISLTEKGKEQQATFRRIFAESEVLMVAGLSEEEIRQLHALLHRVMTNLEEDRNL
jgi:DNA-binding transcriptional LysR family regulator